MLCSCSLINSLFYKVVIPVTLCIVIIMVYIMLGAVMFHNWEGWDLISSAYFCFITLTTVNTWSKMKIQICAIRLVLGTWCQQEVSLATRKPDWLASCKCLPQWATASLALPSLPCASPSSRCVSNIEQYCHHYHSLPRLIWMPPFPQLPQLPSLPCVSSLYRWVLLFLW